MAKTFNFGQVKDIVRKYLSGQDRPSYVLCLVSGPGQGKTSLVKSVASELGLKLVTVPCSSITRQTFNLSFIIDGQLTTLTLDALSDPNTILFLEEIDRTPQSALPIVLPIFAGRIIGKERVLCHLITTANFPDRLASLDTALPTRLILLYLKTDISETFQYLTTKYRNMDAMTEKVITALRLTAEQFEPNSDEWNPRQIDHIVEVVYTIRPSKIDETLALLSGNMPSEIYETFANFLLYSDIPSPSDPKILSFISERKPSGKHFFATRQLILHIATCSQKDCSHPKIHDIIRTIINSSPVIIDTFTSAIVDLPIDQRTKIVEAITKFDPKDENERKKVNDLYNLMTTIISNRPQ